MKKNAAKAKVLAIRSRALSTARKRLGLDGQTRKMLVAEEIQRRYKVPNNLYSVYEILQWFVTNVPQDGVVSTAGHASAPFAATNEFLSSYEWRRLRMEVIQERGARCECCGASPKDGRTVINVDHIKPRKLFPQLALDKSNLQVLCHVCNHGKGNWDQTDWREPSESADPVVAMEERLRPLWSSPRLVVK